MIGRVVSTKMNKTAAVLVERVARHPLYKKTFIRSKKYLVDVRVPVQEGDMVEMVKVRPVSRNKHWAISKVVGKNLAEINEEKLKAEAEQIVAEVMPESADRQVSGSEDQKEEKKDSDTPTHRNTDKPKKKKETK